MPEHTCRGRPAEVESWLELGTGQGGCPVGARASAETPPKAAREQGSSVSSLPPSFLSSSCVPH